MQAQNRIEGQKSFYISIFIFSVENQAAWLSSSRDTLVQSPFGNLRLQRHNAPIEIAAYCR